MAIKSIVTLALECSADQASTAVGVDGMVVAQSSIMANHGHAAWMIPLVKEVLEQSSHGFDDLTHILAGRGPGSFTGIRVALAAAKGLGLSLGAKVIGVSSLEGMAAAVRKLPETNGRHVITMIDSRRGSIFFQPFTPDGIALAPIQDSDIGGIVDSMKGEYQWAVAGFAANEVAATCPAAVFVDHFAPHAADLIALYTDNVDPPSNHLEPLYLSAPLLGPR